MKLKYRLPVSEKFNSIQGEGLFVGRPVRFIRVSGCTRQCSFCDSKYHIKGKKVSVESLVEEAVSQSLRTIIITGGEPLLYWDALIYFWKLLNKEKHFILQLETNGDLLYKKKVAYSEMFSIFDYVCISPKSREIAKTLYKELSGPLSKGICDMKVVTDMKGMGVSLIKYATVLMPLTTYNENKDIQIRKKVWDYCVKNGLRYSPRLHIEVFGKCKGV